MTDFQLTVSFLSVLHREVILENIIRTSAPELTHEHKLISLLLRFSFNSLSCFWDSNVVMLSTIVISDILILMVLFRTNLPFQAVKLNLKLKAKVNNK